MDILAAIEATEPLRTNRRCIIGRFLDDIPDSTEGKEELTLVLTTRDRLDPNWRPGDQLDVLLMRLGLKTSNKSIGDHRANRCRCNR